MARKKNELLTDVLVDALTEDANFSTRNEDTRSKIYLENVEMLHLFSPEDIKFVPGWVMIPLNPLVYLKRHVSGFQFLSLIPDIFKPGGYMLDVESTLESIRSVMYEDIPADKTTLSFPIEGTPFWFTKYGKVDIQDPNGTSEVDNFTVLEARFGDKVFAYAMPAMCIIDAIYRLKNLTEGEKDFIMRLAFRVADKSKNRKLITKNN